MPNPASELAMGFEDLRPFIWRDRLWCCAGIRELSADASYEFVLAGIDERTPGTCRLTDWRVLRPDNRKRDEKNWMPRVSGETLQFIYACDPTRVVDEEARTVVEVTPTIAAEQFRGGSQAIEFEGGWLALVHETLGGPVHKDKIYHHRFVWFDAADALRRLSRPFFIRKKGLEFVAGLAWHPDGNRLIVSYGAGDSESWIATIEAADVRRILEEADASGAPNQIVSGGARQLSPKIDAVSPSGTLTRLPGTVVTTTIFDERIYFFVVNPDDSVAKFHYAGSFYEQEELAIISKYFRGGTFLDIEANVGNHAIFVSKFIHPSKVIVFEPNPIAINVLRINLALNGCTTVDTRFLAIALAAQEGKLKAVTPDPNNIGNTMFLAAGDADTLALPGDALLLDERIDFIKLDVEGMEMEILSGLKHTIARWRPTMFVEVWERMRPDFLAWCDQHNYHVVEQYERYKTIQNYLVMAT
jgi:FkbM family methyltransferase